MTSATWLLLGLIVGTVAGLVNVVRENRRDSGRANLRRELDWHERADR